MVIMIFFGMFLFNIAFSHLFTRVFQHCVIFVNRFHFYVVDDKNEDNYDHNSEKTESKRHYDF